MSHWYCVAKIGISRPSPYTTMVFSFLNKYSTKSIHSSTKRHYLQFYFRTLLTPPRIQRPQELTYMSKNISFPEICVYCVAEIKTSVFYPKLISTRGVWSDLKYTSVFFCLVGFFPPPTEISVMHINYNFLYAYLEHNSEI